MSFGHPLLLLTLLLLPAAVVAYLWNERRRARYAVRFTNLVVLEQVVGVARPWRRWLTTAAFLLAIGGLCVAVARPHVNTTVTDENATVVLVLDVSGSMHAVDVKPTRLVAAQKAVHTFLDKVPKRLKVGLVLFAGEAEVATPPTTDHELVGEAVDQAGFFNGFGGTAIGDAIDLAVRVGIQSAGISGNGPTTMSDGRQLASYVAAAQPTKSTLVSILFLSDGKQNRGTIQPLDGAATARRAGVPVYTVALGTTGNTQLQDGYGGGNFGGFPNGGGGGGGFAFGNLAPDPATLRAIARITGGQFYRAQTAGALEHAYSALGSKLGQRHGTKEITDLFAFGAALLLVGAGVASAFWAPRLP